MRIRIRAVLLLVPVLAVGGVLASASAAGAADDTAPPTLAGPASGSNFTPTGFTATWPAGSDNVGITSYELTLGTDGGGQRFDVGNVLTYTFTGLNPGGRYSLGLRARDAAGNWSIGLALPIVYILPTTVDTTPPTAPGKPTITNLTGTSFTANWTASTDNVGVARYEVWVGRFDYVYRAGTTGPSTLSLNVTGLQPNEAVTVHVRAFDAAGNSTASPWTSFTTPPTGLACTATYRVLSSWQTGFTAEVTVTNTSAGIINSWTVRWIYPSGQRITQLWNAALVLPGPQVEIRNSPGNGFIAPGGTRTFGFLGSLSGPNVPPTPSCTTP